MERRIRMSMMLGAVLLAGCAQTFDASTLGVPATMASPAGEAVAGQPFEVTTHTVHALWGLVSLKKANLDRALATELVGGKSVAQVKIRTRATWKDLLLTGLTLGIFAPRTVTYEGVILGR